jgi:oligopeptidase B
MYGYGAYESCDEPAYDPSLACLLDRGVVFAHAHVRGGGEMGRDWWFAGRLAAKATTFTDYLAVADWLAGSDSEGGPDSESGAGIVAGDRIATRGLSAGGLLQGAVMSMRPDRFRAIVAEVPFVDVVTTMSDPNIPLTVNEWDEWGNPHDPADYAVMLAYSPYDNVPDGPLPRLLVTGALQDPRVPVHEPAKWVAKLRASAADGAPQVLFRVELGAGAHTGPSGRFAHLAYEAEILAFILDAIAGDPGPSRTDLEKA